MDFDALLGQLEASRPDLTDSLALIRQFHNQNKDNTSDTDSETNRAEELTALLSKQKNINKNLLQNYHLFRNTI